MDLTQVDSSIDVNNLLANALPIWEQRRQSHLDLAKAARDERERQMAAVLGTPSREWKERVWRAAEQIALTHEHEAARYAERIATAKNQGMLLFDGDPGFDAEFAGLKASCLRAGRVAYTKGGPYTDPEWAIQIPFNVIQAWGV